MINNEPDTKYFINEYGAKIYADLSEAASANLIFASYNEDIMTSIAIIPVSLTDGETCIGSQLSIDGATNVKVMLLTDFDSLTPLCTHKVK